MLKIHLPVKCLILLLACLINRQTFGHPAQSHTAPLTYEHDRYSMNAKCMDQETGREMYVGDSFTRSGRCIRVQCLGDLSLWEDRCQVPHLEEHCYRIPAANEFLDYPRCCPTYECKSYKIDGHSITDETRTYNHYGSLLREHITNRVLVMVNPPHHITTTAMHSNRTDGGGSGGSGRWQYNGGSRYAPPAQPPSSNTTSVFRIN